VHNAGKAKSIIFGAAREVVHVERFEARNKGAEEEREIKLQEAQTCLIDS
jgi:hypothetical protein